MASACSIRLGARCRHPMQQHAGEHSNNEDGDRQAVEAESGKGGAGAEADQAPADAEMAAPRRSGRSMRVAAGRRNSGPGAARGRAARGRSRPRPSRPRRPAHMIVSVLVSADAPSIDWLAEPRTMTVPSWPRRSRISASSGRVPPAAMPATAAHPISAASQRRARIVAACNPLLRRRYQSGARRKTPAIYGEAAGIRAGRACVAATMRDSPSRKRGNLFRAVPAIPRA